MSKFVMAMTLAVFGTAAGSLSLRASSLFGASAVGTVAQPVSMMKSRCWW